MNTEWTDQDEQALKFMQTHLDDPYPSEMDRLKLALICKTEANALLRTDLGIAEQRLTGARGIITVLEIENTLLRRRRNGWAIAAAVFLGLLVWSNR
jgi:hypothetical protein